MSLKYELPKDIKKPVKLPLPIPLDRNGAICCMCGKPMVRISSESWRCEQCFWIWTFTATSWLGEREG